MIRDKMLNKLHGIHVGVSLVALTSEGALECTCVTPIGSSYEWMDLNNWKWPAYKVSFPAEYELQRIQEKISRTMLVQADIANTELESLYLSCISEDDRTCERLNKFFSKLVSFTVLPDRTAFVLFDGNVVNFFSEYASLEKAFSEYWGVTPWEEYSDDALEEMLAQIEDGFDQIPLLYFDVENDD